MLGICLKICADTRDVASVHQVTGDTHVYWAGGVDPVGVSLLLHDHATTYDDLVALRPIMKFIFGPSSLVMLILLLMSRYRLLIHFSATCCQLEHVVVRGTALVRNLHGSLKKYIL